MRHRTSALRRFGQLTLAILMVTLAGLSPTNVAATSGRKPADSPVDDALVARITQEGLDYIALLLEKGLEADNLRRDIVNALENQVFEILVPQLGGYAIITVDYGDGRPNSELDGFRYDDVTIELSSIPLAPRVPPESGVVYPALTLNNFNGDELPELHVFITYPPFIPASTPISAVVEAVLVTSGVLRPSFDGGDFRVAVENFETNVFQMAIKAWGAFPAALSEQEDTLKETLGTAILEGARKEVNDALSGVFISGLNDILFDRDRNGEPDSILSIDSLLEDVNGSFDTKFSYAIKSHFQSNPVTPAEVYLAFDAVLDSEVQHGCLGEDVDAGFPYTLLEQDGNFGHDPPRIPDVLASGERYQYGLSLSDDFVNSLLFAVYRTGRLCFSLGYDTPGLPEDLRNLLTTNNFAAFPNGQWLQDALPDAPVRIEFVPYQSAIASFPVNDSDNDISVTLPGFYLNIYGLLHGTWLRLVGYNAQMTASVDWTGINLREPPFLEFSLDLQAQTVPIFGPLVEDAEPRDVASLFPTLVQLAGGNLEDLAGDIDLDIVACIDGIDVDAFELRKDGLDGDIAHFLQLLIRFDGIVDLGYLLTQCLLQGDSLVAPPYEKLAGEKAMTANSMTANSVLSLGELPFSEEGIVLDFAVAAGEGNPTGTPTGNPAPKWYRVNGLAWNRYENSIPANRFWAGANVLEVRQQHNGQVSLWKGTVVRDQTPPTIAYLSEEEFSVGDSVRPGQGRVEQIDARGQTVATLDGLGSMQAWHETAVALVAFDSVGNLVRAERPAPQSFGCSTPPAGNPTDGLPTWLIAATMLLLALRWWQRPDLLRGLAKSSCRD